MKLILRSILALAIAGSPFLAGQEPQEEKPKPEEKKESPKPKSESKPKPELAPEDKAKPKQEHSPKSPGRDPLGPRLFHRKTEHPKARKVSQHSVWTPTN
jgi:hypothetical protein